MRDLTAITHPIAWVNQSFSDVLSSFLVTTVSNSTSEEEPVSNSIIIAAVLLLTLIVIYAASKIGGEICNQINLPVVLGEGDVLGIIVLAVVAGLAQTGETEVGNVVYLIIRVAVFLVGAILVEGLILDVFLILVAILGKVITGLTVFSKPGINRLAVGVGLIPQEEVRLVFLSVGAASGTLGKTTEIASLMMVIVTTFLASPFLRLVFQDKPQKMLEVETKS